MKDNNYLGGKGTAHHTVEVIGIIHSCYREKFGIPRQAGLVKSARSTIELLSPFSREEMIRGLQEYSHVWVHFIFHKAVEDGWKATVRPPRLGGQERVGVFATRSPHRPNHTGLSAVELVGISRKAGKIRLEIGGGDFLDGTPVLDIKPYVPYCDCLPLSTGPKWFEETTPENRVSFSPEAQEFCDCYEREKQRPLKQLIQEILENDPRPAPQREKKSEYGILLWDVNVRWIIRDEVYYVMSCCLRNNEGEPDNWVG